MSEHSDTPSQKVTKEDFGFAGLLNMTSEQLLNLWSVLVDRSDIYSMMFKGIAIGLAIGAMRKIMNRVFDEEDNQRPHQD